VEVGGGRWRCIHCVRRVFKSSGRTDAVAPDYPRMLVLFNVQRKDVVNIPWQHNDVQVTRYNKQVPWNVASGFFNNSSSSW
jgi:hypothetical protein